MALSDIIRALIRARNNGCSSALSSIEAATLFAFAPFQFMNDFSFLQDRLDS